MNIGNEIPLCCGKPVKVFQMRKGWTGDWVAHCIYCCYGTTPQDSREAAIEAWEEECT